MRDLTALETQLLMALMKIREEIEGPAGGHRATQKVIHLIADAAIVAAAEFKRECIAPVTGDRPETDEVKHQPTSRQTQPEDPQ